MKKMCAHYFISGQVQGVAFRVNTQKKANELGVTGWVKNLPDGRVEVMLCGGVSGIEKMHHWLQQGPEHANVTQVQSTEVDFKNFDDFEILA